MSSWPQRNNACDNRIKLEMMMQCFLEIFDAREYEIDGEGVVSSFDCSFLAEMAGDDASISSTISSLMLLSVAIICSGYK